MAVRTAPAAELVSLAEVIAGAPKGHQAQVGFQAWLAGERCTVTAVLERTAVIADAAGNGTERRLVRHDQLRIEPGALVWLARPDPDALRKRRRSMRPGQRPGTPATTVPEPAAPTPATTDRAPATVKAARPIADPNESPAASVDELDVATAPGAPPPAIEVPDRAAEQSESDVVETDQPRSCGRCGGRLPAHNRKGVCTACQGTCPDCDGPKAPAANRCRACDRRGPLGLAGQALHVAGSLEALPAQVQELLDTVVTLARYAQDLEDELEHQRAAQRQLQRIRRHALVAGTRGRGRS